MATIYFAFPGNESLTQLILAEEPTGIIGSFELRNFPDGETYVRILSDVKGKELVIVCSLNQPNNKLIQLYLFSKTAKSLGASKIKLICPYLAYMRQDKVFKAGEGITSHYIAEILSSYLDELITIDPHLHRIKNLNDVYTLKTEVVHAAGLIADWIKNSIPNALLIGPDSESEQWVSKVAAKAGAAYTILEKVRSGDKNVKVSIPHVEKYKDRTPVLVDDIISTGRTMIETLNHLKDLNMKAPICVVIHPVFSEDAYTLLKAAGASRIVSCNTISHESNVIDISSLLVK